MSPSTPSYLFVYGTLRSDCGDARGNLLRRHFLRLGLAQVAGELFEVGGYPGMREATPDTSEWVTGELYLLRGNDDAVYAQLDEYEECGARFDAPHEYRRQTLPVRFMDQTMDAQVYCYQWPLHAARRISSGDYRLYLGRRLSA